jgi:hypothetical protein
MNETRTIKGDYILCNIDILRLRHIAYPLMVKEKVKFLRSIDPHGLEQDMNNFIEKETRTIIDIFFINTSSIHQQVMGTKPITMRICVTSRDHDREPHQKKTKLD